MKKDNTKKNYAPRKGAGMTQKEIDKKAWEVLENLLKDVPNMELVPSERTKKELLDEDEHIEKE